MKSQLPYLFARRRPGPHNKKFDPKELGEWAEMQFMARAAAQGFTVTKPWGDSARYDFALELNGRFQRVQVKATTSRSGKAYRCSVERRGSDGHYRKYSRDEIDFFAILVIPEEAWYIIPVERRGSERSSFGLGPRNPRNRCFKYLEAWHLLKQAVAKPGTPQH